MKNDFVFDKIFDDSLNDHKNLFEDIKNIYEKIKDTAQLCAETIKNKNTIFTCGNGGSASDAEHISAEFLGRFMKERESLPSIALSSNSAALTAIANDYDYENIFSRQLSGMAKKGDILLALSTSGSSKNVLKVIEQAKLMNLKTILLTSQRGIDLKNIVDICILVPSTSTPRIQEAHGFIGHLICEYVDEFF